ncbi:hypothetical protein GmHk_10G029323 [Glycine max]|nr:hypothetical protein GmHk_10G029323 [Glycine max]
MLVFSSEFSPFLIIPAGMTRIVDYTNYDDMKYAVSCKLSGNLMTQNSAMPFLGHRYGWVREYDRGYSRSPSRYSRRSYSRSLSCSPYISRSRSCSRSRSHNYSDRSRSLSPKPKHSRRSISLSRSVSIKSDTYAVLCFVL